jgi:hypothetical protein
MRTIMKIQVVLHIAYMPLVHAAISMHVYIKKELINILLTQDIYL